MDLPTQIRAALRTQQIPAPSQAWLQALISARTPPPPLASLLATARARLLAADLTAPGLLDDGAGAFPASAVGAAAVEAPEVRLEADVVVQVLDVRSLGRSIWEQVEELEAVERGELTRGRQVVRLPPAGEDDGAGEQMDGAPQQHGGGRGGGGGGGSGGVQARAGAAPPGSGQEGPNATHRLVLQDCKGQKVYGLELKRIDRFGVGKLNIGEKIRIKSGTVVARGTVLLEPANCIVLGGKIEAWHKAWMDGRLARLREEAGANPRPRPGA